jgi:hypothetical protein
MAVYNLPEILAEILRYRQISQDQTKVFQKVKHNRDLCQRTERQLDYMLDNFVKYYAVAYDIQGPRDQGADVVLQVRPQAKEKSSEFSVVVLQIKSYDDFRDGNYLTILRAQHQQALAHYRQILEHYYILLCTDQIEHLQKVRNVRQAFTNFPNVTVISPTYSLPFLRFSFKRIGLIVQDLMREEDIVVARARKLSRDFTPPQNAIMLFLIYYATFKPEQTINFQTLENSSFLTDVYKICPDYDDDSYYVLEERAFRERKVEKGGVEKWKEFDNSFDCGLKDRQRDFTSRLVDDLDCLDDGLVDMERSTGSFELEISEYRPIQSLILDAHVRYGYFEDELLHFAFGTLGIAEHYGLDLVSDDPL